MAADQAPIQSIARGASILFAVADSGDGLRPREISERLEINQQTVYRLARSLAASGLLRRGTDGRYLLGIGVGVLAEAFAQQLGAAEHLAPYVRALAARTEETCYAVGWQDSEIVVLTIARGQNAVQASAVPLGLANDAHARASGKLLLAFEPPAQRDAYLGAHPLVSRTEHTLVDRAALDAEIATAREHGYATDREEFAAGLSCLAVRLGSGALAYALVLSAPTERFDRNFEDYLATAREVAASGALPLSSG